MKKIEFIWRHVLYETIEKRVTSFRQQELAAYFGISSSTVNAAIAPLRRLGALEVGGRGFAVTDYEKILYHWANHRRLTADIARQLHVRMPVREIESQLMPGTIPTAYTAYIERLGPPPADYDKVYCYTRDALAVVTRFSAETVKGSANLFLLTPDPNLDSYPTLPLAQLFVDLWNLSDWYAKDFVRSVKEHIDGLLS